MIRDTGHPLTRLSEEDLNMVVAFVLASGSIKDLAARYGVSYPTMRQRLDRLIERLQQLLDSAPVDPLADYLADLITKGQLSAAAAGRIRELHRHVVETGEGPPKDTAQESEGADEWCST